MSFNPLIFRNNKDGIGAPGDPVAANSTDDNTLVSLAKKLVALLSGTITVTPSAGAATSDNQATEIASLASIDGHVDGIESQIGIVTETAPATDTASSGLNGRLQRIAQRLAAGAANIGKAEDSASADADVGVPAMAVRKAAPANTSGTDGDYEMLQMSAGRLWASVVLEAGALLVGRTVADASAATGGIASTARLASAAASTNATRAKATAGRIYSVSGKNNAAYDVFLVLYDSAANPPVPGTTTIRKKIICPAGQGFVYDWPVGLEFATGIGFAFTKLVADADTTVLVAADVTAFNLEYV